MKTLLIVDDEMKICNMLSQFFESRGMKTRTACSGTEALDKLSEEPPDFLLLDVRMPDMSGLEVLQRAKQQYPNVNVIMLTALDDPDVASSAMALGASDFLTKPFRWSDQELARIFFAPA